MAGRLCARFTQLGLLLLLVNFLVASGAPKPYVNDPNCPRKPELAKGRKCLKKCRTDLDCRGKSRRCLCDDVCGKGCVRETQRCETLKPIFNGKLEITPFNRFGAKVRYTCHEGYILSGLPERVCQGDQYWSGDPPTCETEGKCRDPPTVPHARHDGPKTQRVYPLGTQLTYTCESGYNIDGFFRAMCVGEGRWVGPRMTCSPRRCGHPGDMPNGNREGNAFVFPNRVRYNCNEGYELVGRPFRICQADGQWSGNLPMCRPVKCPRLGPPANGNILGAYFTYGSILRFTCLRGFTLIGSQERKCEQDGSWNGKEATCAMVDCGLPGPFYNGFLDGDQTTFGSIIKFRCYGRTTWHGSANSATCKEDGEWSHSVPKCWSKCEVKEIAHGSPKEFNVGYFMSHDEKLSYLCEKGYTFNNKTRPKCFNGTWSFVPICQPSPCTQRPNDINDGFVRFYTMAHDDRAKYTCATGYVLTGGDEYHTCQYGEWEGKTPRCNPVYCDYPGTIVNGQILLVGVIGKYEYRPYVRRIGHNEQIEFHCHKEYKLVGPEGSTCVDGKWSPPVHQATCEEKQHPKLLYIFRGRRDTSGLLQRAEEEADEMHPGVPLLGDTSSMSDEDIEDIYNKPFCEVPVVPNGEVTNYPTGYYVPYSAQLEVKCHRGFVFRDSGIDVMCMKGLWTVTPTCSRAKPHRKTKLRHRKRL